METGFSGSVNQPSKEDSFSPLTDLVLRDWKRISYKEAWQKQKELVELRIADEITDTLIFCEHPPVITLGRGAQRGESAATAFYPPEIEKFEIERGGLATYHGPGQIVVYPIVKMAKVGSAPYASKGILGLIRSLENWVIAYLRSMNLDALSIPEKTGVWINTPATNPEAAFIPARKIASIGIAARHWVSYHGLSFNFATGMEPWRGFNPCGFQAEVMTDLQMQTQKSWTYEAVKRGLQDFLPAFWGEI